MVLFCNKKIFAKSNTPKYELNNNAFNIQKIVSANANINTSTYANGDGSAFNSSKIPNREIVITVYINGDVSQNRLKLYKYFRNKIPIYD